MDITALTRHFARIGADLEVNLVPPRQNTRWAVPTPEFALDVTHKHRAEIFEITVREDVLPAVELTPLNVRPDLRHLLLLLKREDVGGHEKFLCGHDERHWFVAAVQPAAVDVDSAMETLKPAVARLSQMRKNVRRQEWNKRHNPGFIRQGEWFFIPQPDFTPPAHSLILRNEPLQLGGRKPHMVEELFRTGGQTVYVSRRAPNGISEAQYRRLIARDPAAANAQWRTMRRNPEVYARGRVRHSDHATIVLPFWHRVAANGEPRSNQVAFLD
jgi:hypothetical protein